MDIDATNSIIPNLDSTPNAARRTPQPRTASTDPVDADLGSDYSSVISRALQSDEIDLQAVEQAASLLASGRLDTPQNAQSAAENLLKFGI